MILCCIAFLYICIIHEQFCWVIIIYIHIGVYMINQQNTYTCTHIYISPFCRYILYIELIQSMVLTHLSKFVHTYVSILLNGALFYILQFIVSPMPFRKSQWSLDLLTESVMCLVYICVCCELVGLTVNSFFLFICPLSKCVLLLQCLKHIALSLTVLSEQLNLSCLKIF